MGDGWGVNQSEGVLVMGEEWNGSCMDGVQVGVGERKKRRRMRQLNAATTYYEALKACIGSKGLRTLCAQVLLINCFLVKLLIISHCEQAATNT